MADIELVIKIPEEVKQTFDNAKDEDLYGNYYDRNSLIGKAIRNGTPLPKGHGDLISRQAVLSKIKEVYFSKEWLQFRIDYGHHGQRDFLINYIEQLPEPYNAESEDTE